MEDARRSAIDSAQRVIGKLRAGEQLDRYGYGTGAIREDVKQRFHDDRGTLVAAITQNAYGSLVLNTAQAMFVDIDLDEPSPTAMLSYHLRSLFVRNLQRPIAEIEARAMDHIAAFFRTASDWSARLYRTHSGLRLFATHAEFQPDGDEALQAFSALGADPLYVRLCRDQRCFRARLTPKPWRCGHSANAIAWPRETDEQERSFQKWHDAYLERQAFYATCHLIDTFGSGKTLSTIAPLVDLHDRLTRCGDVLPLA